VNIRLLCGVIARLVAAVLLLGAGPIFAQTYPAKPIKLVVPYAAGGPVDVIARILSDRLGEILQQRVIVENKAGGNAVIGADYVAKAAPDGYTLLVAAPAFTANMSLVKNVPYDAIKDFAPVSWVVDQPLFVVVHPSVPATSIKELIALLKANPDKYNYGTSGSGGPQHLLGEMFKAATGTRITHIPYKGAAPASTALLAGDTQISFSTPTNTFPFVKAGKLRALAVSTAQRSVFAPDLPTLAELGLGGFNYSSWNGVLAPAGTSKEVVQRLYEAIAKALGEKEVRDKFFVQGMDVIGTTPDAFAEYLKLDLARSAKIIKDNGIQPE
jgi:tripartite-type tricarboxylate transporter receptor subunit TctC